MNQKTPLQSFAILLIGLTFSACSSLPSGFLADPALFSQDELNPKGVSQVENRRERVEITEEGEWSNVRLVGIDPLIVQQEKGVWCWAACTEMILKFDGQDVSQESLAARIHGYQVYADDESGEDKVFAASYHDLLHALCPDAPATDFEAVWDGLKADVMASNPDDLGDKDVNVDGVGLVIAAQDRWAPETSPPVEELVMGHPAVVGLHIPGFPDSGHAYLLIGCTYKPESSLKKGLKWVGQFAAESAGHSALGASASRFIEGPEVLRLLLVNPATPDDPLTEKNEQIVSMEIEEFLARVDFVVTRADALRILKGFQGTVGID